MNKENPIGDAKRRKWRWRFSLRSAMLMICVASIILGREVNPYRAQRRSVEALSDRDMAFWSTSARFQFPNRIRERYPWMMSLVSEHVQYRISNVELAQHHGDVVDIVLNGMATTKSLRSATLMDLEWTDARIRDLSRQANLRQLFVLGATTNDRVVLAIAKLGALEKLSLNCTGVSRDVMLRLRDLQQLKVLSLRGDVGPTTVSDLQAALPNAIVSLWRTE